MMSIEHLPAPPVEWIEEITALEQRTAELFWNCMAVRQFKDVLITAGLEQTPSAWAMNNHLGLNIKDLFLTAHIAHKTRGNKGDAYGSSSAYYGDRNEICVDDISEPNMKPSSWLLHTKTATPEEVDTVRRLSIITNGVATDVKTKYTEHYWHSRATRVVTWQGTDQPDNVDVFLDRYYNQLTCLYKRRVADSAWLLESKQSVMPAGEGWRVEWERPYIRTPGLSGCVGSVVEDVHARPWRKENYPLIALFQKSNKLLVAKRRNFSGLRKLLYTKTGNLKMCNETTWDAYGYLLSIDARCWQSNTHFSNRDKNADEQRLLKKQHTEALFFALKTGKNSKKYENEVLPIMFKLLNEHMHHAYRYGAARHHAPTYPEHSSEKLIDW